MYHPITLLDSALIVVSFLAPGGAVGRRAPQLVNQFSVLRAEFITLLDCTQIECIQWRRSANRGKGAHLRFLSPSCYASPMSARRYSDRFVAAALVLLEVNGYPLVFGALGKTASALKVSGNTIKVWYDAKIREDDHRAESRDALKDEIIDLISGGAFTLFQEGLAEREDMPAYKKIIAGAVLTDKLAVLTGGTTQNVRVSIHHTLETTRPPWALETEPIAGEVVEGEARILPESPTK